MAEHTVDFAERLATVEDRIQTALARQGRVRDEVTLIVVTKFHPESTVRALHAIGVQDFGENRHQEARAKAQATSDLDARWHFVGQLQSNKARQAAQYAAAIHSLDRPALVTALSTSQHNIHGFVQINLTDDPARGGVSPEELEPLVEQVLETPTILLRGVMAVAPLDEAPEAAFERLAQLSQRVRSLAPEATAISAGMTHDFETALEYGATHLRIGSAITGNRPY